MSNPSQLVTQEQVEQALKRVETGQTTVEDANLIRSYLRMLSNLLKVYEADDLHANTE